jgi:hypothetical protein
MAAGLPAEICLARIRFIPGVRRASEHFSLARSLARKKLHESKLALSVINLVDETQPRHFCVFLASRPAASAANCKRASVPVASGALVINKRKNGLGRK